jgi:hypothetical protein
LPALGVPEQLEQPDEGEVEEGKRHSAVLSADSDRRKSS